MPGGDELYYQNRWMLIREHSCNIAALPRRPSGSTTKILLHSSADAKPHSPLQTSSMPAVLQVSPVGRHIPAASSWCSSLRLSPFLLGGTAKTARAGPFCFFYTLVSLSHELTKASVSTFSFADHDRTTQVSKYRWVSAASPVQSQGSRSAMQRGHVKNGLGFGARAWLPPLPPFQAQPARGQRE